MFDAARDRSQEVHQARPGPQLSPLAAAARTQPAAPLPGVSNAQVAQVAMVARQLRTAAQIMSAAVIARDGPAFRPNEPVRQDETRRMPDHELFEVLAKDFAYHDVQRLNQRSLDEGEAEPDLSGDSERFLRSQGYGLGAVANTDLTSMEAIEFVPLVTSRRPVVAFRGSAGGPDWMFNLGSNNDPGVLQSILEAGPVAQLIERAAARGPVVLVGHSLGGAMAQLFAAGCYDLVAEVVTFNSPGVPELISEYVQGLNAAAGHELRATHYRMEGDVVDDLGASFLPGTVVQYRDDSIDASQAPLRVPPRDPVAGPLGRGVQPAEEWVGDAIDAHLSMMLNVDAEHAGEVHHVGTHRTGPEDRRHPAGGWVDSALAGVGSLGRPLGVRPQATPARAARDRDAQRFLETMRRVRASHR